MCLVASIHLFICLHTLLFQPQPVQGLWKSICTILKLAKTFTVQTGECRQTDKQTDATTRIISPAWQLKMISAMLVAKILTTERQKIS